MRNYVSEYVAGSGVDIKLNGFFETWQNFSCA